MFYVFANLFNVWLNRKQLGSHFCFCSQSVALCFGESIRKLSLLWIGNWIKKDLVGVPRSSKVLTLRTAALEKWVKYMTRKSLSSQTVKRGSLSMIIREIRLSRSRFRCSDGQKAKKSHRIQCC